MIPYRFLFLGPVQIERDGQPVKLTSAKAMALLAYLAVTGSTQSRDHLTDLLWPDSLPDAARKNMRNTLWSIRKALAEEVLHTEADRMALAGDTVWCDVQAFEAAIDRLRTDPDDQTALDTAIELYRAPLLDGLTVTDAPEFELWLSTARERLGQLYLRALEAQIARHRAAGRWDKVVLTARQALAADNLQEPMHRALMEAHARQGARTDALRQYDTLQNILAHELGVEPLPETETLRAAIVEGRLNQSVLAARAAGTPPVRAARLDNPAVKTARPFVGRQAELAALDQALHRAGQGQAQVVLLTGELGIGKSYLWQHWSSGLATEITVLETRCLDTTQSLPFGPLTTLFSQSVCADQLFQPDSPVSSIWLSELVRLLPEIRQHLPELPAPPVLPPEEEQRRLFEAFVQVLRAIHSQPLLLFIDDLHWADRATLDWLVYMVERLRTEQLLLVGTYRPSEASPQLSRITAGWNREGLLQRLALARLTVSEATQLLEAMGSSERAEQLQTQSAGNPYFLIELSQSEAGDTPPELAELIRARLARLPETAQQVLQAAAVLDSGFDFAILRRTSGRGEEETLNALDDLLAAAILLERNGGYEFVHPLVAAVVHNDLSLARRSFLHRRAAEALEAVFGSRPETIAGQLASHYANAGRPAQAAHYAELAGQRALALTAAAEAVTFYQEALKLEPTPRRRLGFGQAVMLQGDLDHARQIFGKAAEAFEAQTDPVGAAEAYLALAMSYLPSGQGHDVVTWAEKALAMLEPHDEFELQARAHHLLAAGGMMVGHSLAKAETHLQVVIRLATDNDLPDLAGAARFELGNLLAQRGRLAEALQSFEAAINFARASDNLFQLVLGHNNLAYHAMLAGELARAQTHIETGLALAERHSLFVPRQYLYSTRGEVALAAKAFEQAKQWFERAMLEARRNANEALAANIQANLGLVAQQQGDLDEALLLLEAARSATTALTATHLKIEIDLRLAELYRQRGERAAAQEALARAERRLAGSERAGLQRRARQLRQEIEG